MILFFSLFKVTPIMLLKTYVKEADFLLSMLLSLRLLFRVVSRFSVFPSGPFFLRQYPCFVLQNPILPCFLRAVPRAAREWREGVSHGWRVGAPGLVHVFNWAGVLTYQNYSQFRIPFRIPLPQGTGEPISADHSWVGHCDGNYDSTVYPPPYLRQGLVPFLCHESTQL